MLKKEYEILKPFVYKPWQKLTFRQIGKSSKKKSKSYLFKILKKFSKEGILNEEKIGNVFLYSINFDSIKALSYLGFVSQYIGFGRKNIPFKDIEKIASKIPSNFFVLLIAGSYARGEEKKDSDMDLVVLCDDTQKPKQIYSELRYDCEMSIPRIHLYVFTKEQFIEMLLDKKQNYGKEICKENVILMGGEEYFRIIKEAIKNGFND